MKEFFISVISDCSDPNAVIRYQTAFWKEFQMPCFFTPITEPLQAAGTAIDVIDKLQGEKAVVFINAAPRRDCDKEKGHQNGRDFVYFYIGETLVVTSDEPEIFGLFKKIRLPFQGKVRAIKLSRSESQFRSADYLPAVIKSIVMGAYSGQVYSPEVAKIDRVVWHIDNFGNCKTTATKFISNLHKEYQRLTDVPDYSPAQTIGSSGYKSSRWVELVIKKGKYAEKYNMKIGKKIN